MPLYASWDGLNERNAPHTLQPGELTVAQNVICRRDRMEKIFGNDEHATGLADRVPWVRRYYGVKADNTEVKKTFAFSGDSIYVVDDVTRVATKVQSGFSPTVRPESTFVRISENNVLMFFTGEDRPFEYNGNDGNDWNQSIITENFEMGVWWLNRLWAFNKFSSTLFYSATDDPTNFTDSIDAGTLPIASADRGFIVAIALLGDILYIFKNTGIYFIEGKVPDTFAVRTIFDDRGLATKRALQKVGSAFVLLWEQEKRWIEFTGTETGWRDISLNLRFPDRLNAARIDDISTIYHDKLFRVSYPDVRDGGIRPERELIFPTDEMREDGQPKWSNTKGFQIDSYDILNQQNDGNQLITGRSDTGKIMIHGKDRSKNADETPLEVLIRTGDQIGALGWNSRFSHVNISGGVASGTMNVRTYLSSRNETRGNDTLDETGEASASAFGIAHSVPQQIRYNDYFHMQAGFDTGEALAIELQNEELDKNFILYEINVEAQKLHRIRGKMIGA